MEYKKLNKCSECEYFGDGRFPVVRYFVGGELKSKFIGFSDRPNGEVVEKFAHRCDIDDKNKILVYDDSIGCPDFTPKTWERPKICRECSRFKHNYEDGQFTCSGYPFSAYHKGSDRACPNGKCKSGKQYTLFDFLS